MTTNATATTKKRELAEIVADVLGDLAFLVGDEEASERMPEDGWLECGISYRGPMSGRLQCWCTRVFATQLAANLLGIEPEDGSAEAAAHDAVQEFMNVVCGQVVTAWYGREPVFNLTIPTVTPCPGAPGGKTPEHDGWCELSVDDEPFFCAHRPGA
jgi:hypothetical protein